MKLTVDTCESTTGWSATTGLHVDSLCEHRDWIADDLAASLVFHCPGGSLGVGASKDVALTLPAGYDTLVLNIWSRRQNGDAYSISLDGVTYWMVPVGQTMAAVCIGLDSSTVTQLEIVPEHDDEDWIVVSGVYCVREEYPLDVLEALIARIKPWAALFCAGSVGTASGYVGKDHMTMAAPPVWMDRYMVVTITGGGKTETHQVDRMDADAVYFMSTFDGVQLKNSYTGASVTLYCPLRVGSAEQEVAIPGITLWGMAPKPTTRETGVEQWSDSVRKSDLEAAVRRQDIGLTWNVLIDCEARQHELLAAASKAVRRAIGTGRLWINGMAHDAQWTDEATYVEPPGPVDTFPKVQYTLAVEVLEAREARVRTTAAGEATLVVEVG